MKRKILAAVAAVVLVVAVVGLGVVIGRALGPSGADPEPSDGPAAPSAVPTAEVNTDLDNVVAGTGATGTSSTPGFEGVGIRYPATCVGAVQAAAEWTQKVFGSTDLVGPMLDSQDKGKAQIEAFLDEITVSPGLIRLGSDNEMLGESDFRRMLGMFIEYTKPSERDSVTFHAEVQNGVVQVIKCAPEPEGVAVVRIAAPKGEPIGDAHAWYERNYQLQAVNGSWRLVHLIDARDNTPYQQALNPPSLKATQEELRITGARPVTDEARDIIARSLGGQGTHVFANKNGEWGKQ